MQRNRLLRFVRNFIFTQVRLSDVGGRGALLQDAQVMFDNSMTAAAVAAKIQRIQEAAGIKANLVNPYGKGSSVITLTGDFHQQ